MLYSTNLQWENFSDKIPVKTEAIFNVAAAAQFLRGEKAVFKR